MHTYICSRFPGSLGPPPWYGPPSIRSEYEENLRKMNDSALWQQGGRCGCSGALCGWSGAHCGCSAALCGTRDQLLFPLVPRRHAPLATGPAPFSLQNHRRREKADPKPQGGGADHHHSFSFMGA